MAEEEHAPEKRRRDRHMQERIDEIINEAKALKKVPRKPSSTPREGIKRTRDEMRTGLRREETWRPNDAEHDSSSVGWEGIDDVESDSHPLSIDEMLEIEDLRYIDTIKRQQPGSEKDE